MAQVLPAPTREEQPHLSPPSLSDPRATTPTPKKPFPVTPQQPKLSLHREFDPSRSDVDDDDLSDDTSDYFSYPVELQRYPSNRRFYTTSSSSTSLDSTSQDEDEELSFPTYNDSSYAFRRDSTEITSSSSSKDSIDSSSTPPSLSDTTKSTPTSPGPAPVSDDTAVREEPTLQVDYLSHEWKEEDIWRSWKHIVSKRKVYGEVSRLENASWRTWAKSKFKLRTVSPERLNWMKDCDVTWLYGPLQTNSIQDPQISEPPSRLSKSSSFLNKKPILKKRSVSEVMLAKSLSSSSLIKQAAAAVQAQRTGSRRQSEDQNGLQLVPSDFIISDMHYLSVSTSHDTNGSPSTSSSGLQTPDDGRRHIRFDNKVEQCIAVDFRESFADDELEMFEDPFPDESDDDDLPMMKAGPRRSQSSTPTPGSSRGSFSQESKGIAMLPSTTIKFHDDPTCLGHPDDDKEPFPSPATPSEPGKRITHSSSQETLRPPRPYANFLLDEEGDDAGSSWDPAGAFGKTARDAAAEAEDEARQGLRRTPSGMFMPLDSDDSDDDAYPPPGGLLGRAVDTVNTFRDIAHVIWNVGWRK